MAPLASWYLARFVQTEHGGILWLIGGKSFVSDLDLVERVQEIVPTYMSGFPVNYSRAVLAMLAVLIVVAYLPVLNCGFVNFDDDSHVRANPIVAEGLTIQGISNAFTQSHAALWIPLTWVSFMADVSIFGMKPAGFHIMNVLLHVANAALLFLLLSRITGRFWASAVIAACFGVHPLNVESVAWIAERKNVLCGFFFLLCLYAYQSYAARPRSLAYIAACVLAAMALMAKPMAVTIPFALLLLDFWPLDRWRRGAWKRLIAEKIPFAFLSLAICLATLVSAGHARSNELLHDITFGNRVRNALVSYRDYVLDIFWPSDLAVLYPHPFVIPWWPALLSLLLIVGVTSIAYALRRRCPYLVWGWLWFLGILVPMIGLVQVGPQARADRFTYLAQIGILVPAVFLVSELVRGKVRKALPSVSAALIVILTALTGQQVTHWTDTAHLFEHTGRVTRNNTRAFVLAGTARMEMGDYRAAATNFRAAVNLHPEVEFLWLHLGDALARLAEHEEARRCFLKALEVNPNSLQASVALAKSSELNGDSQSAISYLEKAVQLAPDSADLYRSLGELLLKTGEVQRAQAHFETANRMGR